MVSKKNIFCIKILRFYCQTADHHELKQFCVKKSIFTVDFGNSKPETRRFIDIRCCHTPAQQTNLTQWSFPYLATVTQFFMSISNSQLSRLEMWREVSHGSRGGIGIKSIMKCPSWTSVRRTSEIESSFLCSTFSTKNFTLRLKEVI